MYIDRARAADGAAIEALLDAAFGSDRHRRTAALLRAGTLPFAATALVARGGGRLLGSVRCSPLALVSARAVTPLTLLGPLAVAPAAQGQGIGRALVQAALAAADASGLPPVMLIGDLDYYAQFGFANTATRGWRLPGPVDPARVLLRANGAATLPWSGRLVAAPAEALAA